MQYWLVLLGRNAVKVMGSSPARAIVIEVFVVSSWKKTRAALLCNIG
jgi:hypothetical protein